MISLVMPSILMSICGGGHTFGGTGNLEVHVAQVIFVTQDVGQHGKPSSSFTRPMAIPATEALIGTPASISAREEPQTEAMEEEPLIR